MTRALGLDLSVSATGVVLLESNGQARPRLLIEDELKPASKLKGIARQRALATEVMLLIQAHSPDLIVVEGYSLNMKNAASVVPLIELGGIVRLMLHIDGLSWFDPRAGELKKFVTGKGNSPKDVVMMHVLKRWGHESISNNTADAYGLACMGLARTESLPGITKDMAKIAADMTLKTA